MVAGEASLHSLAGKKLSYELAGVMKIPVQWMWCLYMIGKMYVSFSEVNLLFVAGYSAEYFPVKAASN